MDVDDVMHIRLPNPMHETKPATAPAITALAAAKVLNNVDKFAAVFFERGAIKVTMLTVTGMPQQAERERLKSVWQRITNGIRGAFGAEVFNAESVKPVVIGDGIQELSNVTLTREKREDIATALGVPHAMVMSNETGAKATTQQDEIYFYTQTAIPECKLIQRQFNKQLLAPLGLRLQFEPQKMSVFQEDEEQRSMSLMHYVQAGFPVAMAAEILGVALPDGVEDYAQLDAILGERQSQRDEMARMIAQSTQPAPQPAPVQAEDNAPSDVDMAVRSALWRVEAKSFRKWLRKNPHKALGKFVANYLTDEEKETIKAEVSADADFFTNIPLVKMPSIWIGDNIPDAAGSVAAWKALVLQLDDDDDEAEQRARDAIEAAATNNIEQALRKQQREIQRIARNLNADSLVRWMAEDLEQAFTRSRDEYDLYDMLRRALLQSVDLGVSVAVAQFDNVGFGFDWTLANDNARRWAEQYAGELVWDINATSLERTRRAVSAWVDNGEALGALIEDLTPIFGRGRAELIASTEVTRAYSHANQQAYIDSGVVDIIEFRTSRDERVCLICGPRHNARTDVRNPDFDGYGLPPLHPRCRCWIVPVIEEPEAVAPQQVEPQPVSIFAQSELSNPESVLRERIRQARPNISDDAVDMYIDAMSLDKENFKRYAERLKFDNIDDASKEFFEYRRELSRQEAKALWDNQESVTLKHPSGKAYVHSTISDRLDIVARKTRQELTVNELSETLRTRYGVNVDVSRSNDLSRAFDELRALANIADEIPELGKVLRDQVTNIGYDDGFGTATASYESITKSIKIWNNQPVSPTTWIHEIGHAAEEYFDSSDLSSVFGSGRFVSMYAQGNYSEDFAETFTMILGGQAKQVLDFVPEKYLIVNRILGITP
jgi:SPP1 gp7 family putative phage head morphogenesis protein